MRKASKTLLTEKLAEDQISSSQHSAEDNSMLQPVSPPQDVRLLPLFLPDPQDQDFQSQPAITRYCSTPGGWAAQMEETHRQRLELVRSAASTPRLSTCQIEDVFSDDDVLCGT